jgi:hypothetical protein
MGDLVGWKLNGRVPQHQVREAAEEQHLGGELAFPRVTPSSGYRRAVRSTASGWDGRRYTPVLIQEDEDRIVHAIVRSGVVDRAVEAQHVAKVAGELQLQRDVEIHEEIRVRFDKDGHRAGKPASDLVLVDKPTHELALVLLADYRRLCVEYSADDIRGAFQGAFARWHGQPQRDRGGLWWLPPAAASKVRSWARFLEALGCVPTIFPLFDTSETMAALRHSAHTNLLGRLCHLQEQLRGYAENGSRTRLATLERRAVEFDAVRTRATVYEEVLGMDLERVKDEAEQACRTLATAITSAGQSGGA